MPMYEYFCESCQKEFTSLQTLDEHDHEAVRCPQCGGDKVHQMVSSFFAVTSKKS
jgi:putative FmdB family regulatory protein